MSFIEVQNIHKRFAGVYALKDVSLDIGEGEIRCLAGENGSGKSTLIKVIAGVHQADEGRVVISGVSYRHLTPIEAIRAGVQVIYQDFSLFPNLTVAENLAINTQLEQRRRLVNWPAMRRIAERALERIKVDIPLESTVGELSVADRQLVAISRALVHDARLVIMDEPTTALTQLEIRSLFDVISDMKAEGIATLFVSHKLREVLDISEKITILRNGRKAAEGAVDSFDEAAITYQMTGREVSGERFRFNGGGEDGGTPVLSVKNLRRAGAFDGISFDVYPGEIVGITGLLGSGRSELALSLFGVLPADGGTTAVSGRDVRIDSIQAAVAAGVSYLPEDRLTEGLFLEQTIARNIFVTILDRIKTALGVINFKAAAAAVKKWIGELNIATPSPEIPVSALSGGNQQRVVLARWLAAGARVLLLNGPTVGVDVGSKEDIHARLRMLAAGGAGVVMMSDDIPELVQNCNRVFVMHKGRFVHEFGDEIDEAALTARFAVLE